MPPTKITRVRAFTTGSGPECGIEGFSASAHELATGASGATYYRISYLARGRCNAPAQRYSLYMDAVCDGKKMTLQKFVNIAKGTRHRVDFAFP